MTVQELYEKVCALNVELKKTHPAVDLLDENYITVFPACITISPAFVEMRLTPKGAGAVLCEANSKIEKQPFSRLFQSFEEFADYILQ